MPEPTDSDAGRREESGHPSVSSEITVGGYEPQVRPAEEDELAPSEAFQTLADELRIAVLLALLDAERAGETPLSFSSLQTAVEADSSAGFAYHLRQLTDHFIQQRSDGYVLTPAGRRAAEAILSGTFTSGHDSQAS
ncbi:MAG: hypothetical protein SVG88_10125 [Halobacteriales archaeon]|nr:hypothetical protein [Halobacteriales archaeon]